MPGDEGAGQEEPARAASCSSRLVLAAARRSSRPTWPASRLQPLSSRNRAGSIRSAPPRTPRPARRSIQIIAGRSGSPAAVAATRPSSCEPNDSAPTRAPSTAGAPRPAPAPAAPSHARGSCSAQPGRGYESVCARRRRDQLAVRVDRLRAGALRADVDAEHERRGHSAPPSLARPAAVDRELESVGQVVLLRDEHAVPVGRAVELEERQQQLPRGDAQALGDRVGGGRRDRRRRRGGRAGRARPAPRRSSRPATQHASGGSVLGPALVGRVDDAPAVRGAHAAQRADRPPAVDAERLRHRGRRGLGRAALARRVPGSSPNAAITSVTPELRSRLFRSTGRCVT